MRRWPCTVCTGFARVVDGVVAVHRYCRPHRDADDDPPPRCPTIGRPYAAPVTTEERAAFHQACELYRLSRRLHDDEWAGLSLDTKDAALTPWPDERANRHLVSKLYSEAREALALVGQSHFPFPTRRQLGLARRRFLFRYAREVVIWGFSRA